MAPTPPFATVEDLEKGWRSLDSLERADAEERLLYASHIIMTQTASWDTVDPVILRNITRDMVKRAMTSSTYGESGGDDDLTGIYPEPRGTLKTESHSTGPFSDTYTYDNPQGDLYLRDLEWQLLGGRKRSSAKQINLLKNHEVLPWL